MAYSIDLFSVKKRLTEWGCWCEQIVTCGLGHSHQSLLAKMQNNGGVMIRATNKNFAPNNPRAEEVNALIEGLARCSLGNFCKPEWAKVLRIHYTMLDRSVKERVFHASINERTYYRYLKEAQSWLSEHLDDS